MTAPNNVVQLLRTAGRSKPQAIHVEKLGESLLFQKLTVAQAKAYTFGMVGNDNKPKMEKVKEHKVELVRLSIVNEDSVQQTTVEVLNEVDNDVLEELFGICQKLNGMGNTDPQQEQFDLFKAGKLTADELAAALKDPPKGNG